MKSKCRSSFHRIDLQDSSGCTADSFQIDSFENIAKRISRHPWNDLYCEETYRQHCEDRWKLLGGKVQNLVDIPESTIKYEWEDYLRYFDQKDVDEGSPDLISMQKISHRYFVPKLDLCRRDQ